LEQEEGSREEETRKTGTKRIRKNKMYEVKSKEVEKHN
jgi:hypothetical protein